MIECLRKMGTLYIKNIQNYLNIFFFKLFNEHLTASAGHRYSTDLQGIGQRVVNIFGHYVLGPWALAHNSQHVIKWLLCRYCILYFMLLGFFLRIFLCPALLLHNTFLIGAIKTGYVSICWQLKLTYENIKPTAKRRQNNNNNDIQLKLNINLLCA